MEKVKQDTEWALENPVENNMLVKLPNNLDVIKMFIYNAHGQLVRAKHFIAKTPFVQLNMSSLSSGLYTLQIQGAESLWVRKFIKM